MNKKVFKKALTAALPVMYSYLIIGMGFGMVAQSRGFGALWAGAMSVFIYAGSMQFVALRFLPFLLFGGKRETPPFIAYLGRVLPSAIMAMLVVYCLRNVQLSASPFGIPELLSCAVVVLLHVWKRSTILSILGSTACYMLLVQLIF